MARRVEVAADRQDRYSLANGCYALRSKSYGGYVVKVPAGYRAGASDAGRRGAVPDAGDPPREHLLYGQALVRGRPRP